MHGHSLTFRMHFSCGIAWKVKCVHPTPSALQIMFSQRPLCASVCIPPAVMHNRKVAAQKTIVGRCIPAAPPARFFVKKLQGNDLENARRGPPASCLWRILAVLAAASAEVQLKWSKSSGHQAISLFVHGDIVRCPPLTEGGPHTRSLPQVKLTNYTDTRRRGSVRLPI